MMPLKFPIPYSDISNPAMRSSIREWLINRQRGKCWFCNEPLEGNPPEPILSDPIDTNLFPPRFFYYDIHIHHDHKTDLVQGAVHARCNAWLWQYHGK